MMRMKSRLAVASLGKAIHQNSIDIDHIWCGQPRHRVLSNFTQACAQPSKDDGCIDAKVLIKSATKLKANCTAKLPTKQSCEIVKHVGGAARSTTTHLSYKLWSIVDSDEHVAPASTQATTVKRYFVSVQISISKCTNAKNKACDTCGGAGTTTIQRGLPSLSLYCHPKGPLSRY